MDLKKQPTEIFNKHAKFSNRKIRFTVLYSDFMQTKT